MCWTCSVINEAELEEGKPIFLSFQDMLGAQLLVRLAGAVQRWDLWGLESAQPRDWKIWLQRGLPEGLSGVSAGTCSLCKLCLPLCGGSLTCVLKTEAGLRAWEMVSICPWGPACTLVAL